MHEGEAGNDSYHIWLSIRKVVNLVLEISSSTHLLQHTSYSAAHSQLVGPLASDSKATRV